MAWLTRPEVTHCSIAVRQGRGEVWACVQVVKLLLRDGSIF